MNDANVVLIFLLWLAGFSAMWMMVTLSVSLLGGWRGLARKFPADAAETMSGERFRFQSVMIGWFGRYSLGITATVGPRGLLLKPIIIYALGHEPIFIPWEEVTGPSYGRFIMEYVDFTLGGKKVRIAGESVPAIRKRRGEGGA